MHHGFTLYVLLTATAAFFLDELTATAKRVWANLLLRNGGLMFFIAFFSFPYQAYIKEGLLIFLEACADAIAWLMPMIPLFTNKRLIAAGLLLVFLSLISSLLLWCFYYIAKRKSYSYTPIVMWIAWLAIASMFLSL